MPQGSILGPILFLIYINDLPNISQLFHPVLFADDTTLTLNGTEITDLIHSCNTELQMFKRWSDSNRLSISVEKSHCVLVTNRNVPADLNDLMLNDNSLNFLNQCVFLGVTFDKNLRYNEHIESICKKVSKSIGIMYRLRSYVPLQTLKTLYNALIYPYLSYCIVIWGGTYFSHLKPLIILQKKLFAS